MNAQGRGEDWVELPADPEAEYDGVIEISARRSGTAAFLARTVPIASCRCAKWRARP